MCNSSALTDTELNGCFWQDPAWKYSLNIQNTLSDDDGNVREHSVASCYSGNALKHLNSLDERPNKPFGKNTFHEGSMMFYLCLRT